MKRLSLSFKITSAFVVVSFLTVVSLFVIFSSLFEDYMLETEKEKVTLIAETIEPMVAMNAYLGLKDEILNLAQQIESRRYVLGGSLDVQGEVVWEKSYDENLDHFHVQYPVNDPISMDRIGTLLIAYSKESFNLAVTSMRIQVMYYLVMLGVFFLVFAMVIRYLLKPLGYIAKKVKGYQLGDDLDFTNIRLEPETEAISDAFDLMVDNIREYTVLLEQYKLSVDESSIVSKMSADGIITYVNDEFVRVCGYSRDELIDSECGNMRDRTQETDVYSQAWDSLRKKEIWKGVVKNIAKSGDPFYVKTTIVPLLDENNEVLEFISIQHDITEVVQQRELIQKQVTDDVTGLPNRVKLTEDTHDLSQIFFSILSLDNYDVIKNYYGYESSIKTLKTLATALVEILSKQNIQVYKLAGGEFALMTQDNMDLDWFKQICQFTMDKIESTSIDAGGDSVDLHVSIGCTTSIDNFLRHAGLALRHAREHRIPMVYYEDQENLIAQYENNISWTRKIKSALADDRITLFVQPLIEAATMQVTKYECLVRMVDEEDSSKYISPFFFLEVAKKTKLYHAITWQVINLAFETFSRIPDKSFGINLSAEDILHEETVEYLESMIQKYNIGNRVVLEIVESEGIDSFKEVADFIHRMKSYGCKIAIDDFGTGYSNFSYLMKLEVDHIKVDGSLIKDIDHNTNSQVICSTILSFSKALEMETVAEFVHSEEVLQKVKSLGFDHLQGFHLGEPVPIQTLLASD